MNKSNQNHWFPTETITVVNKIKEFPDFKRKIYAATQQQYLQSTDQDTAGVNAIVSTSITYIRHLFLTAHSYTHAAKFLRVMQARPDARATTIAWLYWPRHTDIVVFCYFFGFVWSA